MRGTPRDTSRDTSDSALRVLSRSVGIIDEYVDQTGKAKRCTSDATRRDLLGALGLDVSSEEAAAESLAAWRSDEREELLAPVRVLRVAESANVLVRPPAGRANGGSWRLEIQTDEGDLQVTEGQWQGRGSLTLRLSPLPLGYHRVRVSLGAGGKEWMGEQALIVVPPRCVTPADCIGAVGAFGLIANLYSVRSDRNWGVGDFSDLASLAEWGATVGADFVGVNPLHAMLNRGADVSPYSPVSRLFRNPIYIDVACVPELEQAPELREAITSTELEAQLHALRESSTVRYEQVMGVKGLVLDALFKVFTERVRGSGTVRDRAFCAYVDVQGVALDRFATWMTLAEMAGHGSDWRTWPNDLRDPASAAVTALRRTHSERVTYHKWLQFEADRQLAASAVRAHDAGMRIGLYQDLAIGTSPGGADVWSDPHLFVSGVSVGAPPDPYAASGQVWGVPPIDPRALRRDRYRYFIDLVRAGFRHAGALRIDHVMGLSRLFWIPDGKGAEHGAYVQYPFEDLLGIIALESVRNAAVVVGEDLGTVPSNVPPALKKWGVLSSKVLYFERDRRGRYKPSRSYPSLALATANTHDMPPLAGFWSGRDIDARRRVGLIGSDADAARARVERQQDVDALLARLTHEKVIRGPGYVYSPEDLCAAVHGFLCRTPSQLVGLSLDDLVGEEEAVNIPGVGADLHPSWTRKMRQPLEVITESDEVRAALRCDGRVRSNVVIG